MSDTSQHSETVSKAESIVDPAAPAVIRKVGIYFILLSILLLYLLITTWPVPEFGGTAFRPVNIFGFSHSWAPERHLMFTVMMAGAMGMGPDLALGLIDVSTSGVQVRLAGPLHPGEKVQVALWPPRGARAARGLAVVRWCRTADGGMVLAGVQLCERLTRSDLDKLAR